MGMASSSEGKSFRMWVERQGNLRRWGEEESRRAELMSYTQMPKVNRATEEMRKNSMNTANEPADAMATIVQLRRERDEAHRAGYDMAREMALQDGVYLPSHDDAMKQEDGKDE